MAKKGLGRGLDALIPQGTGADVIDQVELGIIDPNPFQPRRSFDADALSELAESIKEHGVVQPLVVRKKGQRFELIAGERRLRASELAGLKTVPVIVQELSDREAMEVALIENLQREDLDPIEEALAYERLKNDFGLTQDEVADRIGKSRPAVANSLRLLRLEPQIQTYVSRGTITMGHARALLRLDAGSMRLQACRKIIEEGLSVRETEELVRQLTNPPDVSRETRSKITPKDPEVSRLESALRQVLGTKVQIMDKKGRGKIEIEYYSLDDLDRILRILKPEGLDD